MGKVKEQVMAQLATDEWAQWRLEVEEAWRLEPEYPELTSPQDGQDAPGQDGDTVNHPGIFERRSDYATALSIGRQRRRRPQRDGESTTATRDALRGPERPAVGH